MPIYTKEWSNYVANYKSLYTYGDIMGLIKPYDEELFKNIRNFYYNNIPAVMLLLDYDFAQGHCYERAKLLRYIFKDDDCTIITADIDHLRYNPKYIEKHINGELGDNYSEHCYIKRFEKDCRMWIYDTSLGYATVEVLYKDMQHPIVKEEIKDPVTLEELGIKEYTDEELLLEKDNILNKLPALREKIRPLREEYRKLIISELDSIEKSLRKEEIKEKVLRKTEGS